MTLLLALLLSATPDAQSRGPSEATIPASVQSAAEPMGNAPELPLDKLLHASISANLVLGVTAVARMAGLPPRWALLLGSGVALVVGALREVLGNGDWQDMAANGLGVGAGVVTAAVFFHAGGEF